MQLFILACRTSPDARVYSSVISCDAKLRLTAGQNHINTEATEYKHIVLDLVFLKHIPDTDHENSAKDLASDSDHAAANPNDPNTESGARQTAAGNQRGERAGANQCNSDNIWWMPKDASWYRQKQPAGAAEGRGDP